MLADDSSTGTNSYVLVGTAGATLLALLFVAVSLGAGFLTDRNSGADARLLQPGRRSFHQRVLHLGRSACFRRTAVSFFAALIGGCAVIGVAVSVFVTVQLLRHDWTQYLEDHLAYGLLPAARLCRTACRRRDDLAENIEYALDVLAGALLLLLIVNIRNAWDLTLSMVRRHSRRAKRER